MTTFTIEELVRKYKRYLKLDGKAEKSIYVYGQDIVGILNYINKDDIDKIMREDYEDYIEDMIDSGQAPATIIRRVRSIQGFYKWLELEEICYNVTYRLPTPSKEKKERLVLHESKINDVISKCDLKYKTLMYLYYEGMMRCNEALGIHFKDVNFETNNIHIRKGKRNKWRYVPMSNNVHKFLKEYIEMNSIKNGKLFKEKDSEVRNNLKSIFEDCGLRWSEQDGYTTHSLRHSGLSKLANSGINMKVLSDISGTSVEVLLNTYIHSTDEAKQNAVNIFNKE